MRREGPFLFWKYVHELIVDLVGIVRAREAQSLGLVATREEALAYLLLTSDLSAPF